MAVVARDLARSATKFVYVHWVEPGERPDRFDNLVDVVLDSDRGILTMIGLRDTYVILLAHVRFYKVVDYAH